MHAIHIVRDLIVLPLCLFGMWRATRGDRPKAIRIVYVSAFCAVGMAALIDLLAPVPSTLLFAAVALFVAPLVAHVLATGRETSTHRRWVRLGGCVIGAICFGTLACARAGVLDFSRSARILVGSMALFTAMVVAGDLIAARRQQQ